MPPVTTDVHGGTRTDVADPLDHGPRVRHGLRLSAEDEQDLGPKLPERGENFVVGHTAAEEEDLPAVGLEEVANHLRAKFLVRAVRTGDHDAFSVGRVLGQMGLQLVGNRAVDAAGHVLNGGVDAIVAVQPFDLGHCWPDDIADQLLSGCAGLKGRRNELKSTRPGDRPGGVAGSESGTARAWIAPPQSTRRLHFQARSSDETATGFTNAAAASMPTVTGPGFWGSSLRQSGDQLAPVRPLLSGAAARRLEIWEAARDRCQVRVTPVR